jgi:ABC-type lipoprotein export system ATPase subunit
MENVSIRNTISNNGNLTVSNLNLQINSGELVCISGLYGTDKISFINTISCLSKPDIGKYLYDYNNTTVIEQNELDSLRSQIGFIFKNLNIIENLTVYQNIEIPINIRGIHEQYKDIVKAAEALGISDLLHVQVKKLSDIEKHKVSLARAIAVNPILVIADEPAEGLIHDDKEFILDALRDINKQGTSIICFSEKRQIIEKAQRHIVFEKGRIKSDSAFVSEYTEEGAV